MIALLCGGILSAVRAYTRIGRAKAIFDTLRTSVLNEVVTADGGGDSSNVVEAAQRVSDQRTTITALMAKAIEQGAFHGDATQRGFLSWFEVADDVDEQLTVLVNRVSSHYQNVMGGLTDQQVTDALNAVDNNTSADTTTWPTWENIARGNETTGDGVTFLEDGNATVGQKIIFFSFLINEHGLA